MEDLIWVRVEVGREKIYVGGAYIVPGSSARARTADEIVRELGMI